MHLPPSVASNKEVIMAKTFLGEMPVRVGRRYYDMRPTIGALRKIERQTGASIVALIALLHESRLPYDTLRLILNEGAKAGGNSLEGVKLSSRALKNALPQPCAFLLQGIGCTGTSSAPLNAQALKLLRQPDWDGMFKIYVGMMGHSAQEFHHITLAEYQLAVEGFAQFHDIDLSTAAPASSQDLAEMLARFPDARPVRQQSYTAPSGT